MQSAVHNEERCLTVTRPLKLETVPCPRCGTVESRSVLCTQDHLYGIAGNFYVASCPQCGLWYQNPRPTPETVASAYPETYLPHNNIAPPDASFSLARKLVRALNPIRRRYAKTALIPEWVADGRLLELGCADGALLQTLRERGWHHLYGAELSESAAQKARARGFDVSCGPLEAALAGFPDRHFDVVVSGMVLEHLYNPFAVIREVARVLKPGGQFLFSTISRDSLDARLYGNYWAGFDLPRHMVYFTRDDLRSALGTDFEQTRCVYQLAWVDFLRSSSWRRANREAHVLDLAVLAIGMSLLGELLSLPLAWLRLTSRVSFTCRRRH